MLHGVFWTMALTAPTRCWWCIYGDGFLRQCIQANSAPMASDGSLNAAKNGVLSAFHRLALKFADTILRTPMASINQTIVGGGDKCKQACLPLCDGTCQWAVRHGGGGGPAARPLDFVCNDANAAASVTLGPHGTYALAERSCKVVDGTTGVELWDSHVRHFPAQFPPF